MSQRYKTNVPTIFHHLSTTLLPLSRLERCWYGGHRGSLLLLGQLLAQGVGIVEAQLAGLAEVALCGLGVALIVIHHAAVKVSLGEVGIELYGLRVVGQGLAVVLHKT